MQNASGNVAPSDPHRDRVSAVVSWAAAYQLAAGLLLGFTALFLVAPSAQTHGYPAFFMTLIVPGALMSGGKQLLGTHPLLGSAILAGAALFDVIAFNLPFEWNVGAVLCASIQGVGALVLMTLAVWGARSRAR